MKRISIAITLFIIGFPFRGYGAEFCLSATTEQEAVKHYSFNHELKSAIDRSGWTWTNREWEGDFYLPAYIQSPDKSSMTKLPELYYKPCSYFQKFTGNCEIAESSFSEVAKIAFIHGYRSNLFGFKTSPKSYTAYGNNITELPSSWRKVATYRGDVNAIGYAGLRGIKEELLLFNGDDLVTLVIPEAGLRKDGYPSWMLSNDLATNRSFVHTNALRGNKLFLYEIKNGPEIHKIALDLNVKGWFDLLSEHSTRKMWMIDRYGIYVETDSGFERVLHLPQNDYINGPANLGYTDQGNIYFEIMSDKKKSPFLLTPKNKNCAVEIDLTQDKILDVKSLAP